MLTGLFFFVAAGIVVAVIAGNRFGLLPRLNIFQHHEAYNNIVIATCALLTLIWGSYTFDVLQQKDRAKAELAEIQKRIRDTESTFLSVNVNVTAFEDEYYLTPTAKIRNSSNEAIYFRLCPDSLSISKVQYDFEARAGSSKTIHPKYYEQLADDADSTNIPLYDIRVPVDSERSLNFFAAVKNTGVYYVTFSALSSNDSEAKGDSTECSFKSGQGISSDNKINGKESIWFSSAYVIVQPEVKQSEQVKH